MKTILHLIDSLETGGAEVMLAGVVPSMKEYNHVIVTLVPGNDFEKQLSDWPVHCLNYTSKLNLFGARKKLRSIIKEHKVDLIHSHLLTATFLARIAKPSSLPLVFSVHNILSRSAFSRSRLSYFLEKISYGKEEHIIFVSDEAKKDYEQSIGIKGNHTVLYNYIADEFFEDKHAKTEYLLKTIPSLVCVGTLKEQKNYAFLIESLAGLKMDFTLDIYGTGPEKKKLESLIKEKGMSEKIFLRGYEPKVLEKLSSYDILIMPSKFEGFGIALVEAMAIGIPTLIAGIDTLISVSDDSSVNFQPDSATDLKEKLTLLLNDQELRESKGIAGRKRASEISLKRNYISKLNIIYQQNVAQQ